MRMDSNTAKMPGHVMTYRRCRDIAYLKVWAKKVKLHRTIAAIPAQFKSSRIALGVTQLKEQVVDLTSAQH